MATKVMSIHQALAEIKLYDSKIHNATMKKFIDFARKGTDKIGSYTKSEYENVLKGNLKSVSALISNRKAIKSAIVLSNATTKINVSGKEYTVADAIERKNAIDYEKRLLHALRAQYSSCKTDVDIKNESISTKLESYLKSVVSEKDKNNPEIVKQYEKQYRDVNEYELIDPSGVANYIEELEKSIEEFETEVDYKLSESNTVTKITVELDD